MALKARISSKVAPSDVRLRISPEFRKFVDERNLGEAAYTVVAFPGMHGSSTSIVDSVTLEKAIRGTFPGGETIIVVAHDFTVEARELLAQANAICLANSDFYWTDDSLARIRAK